MADLGLAVYWTVILFSLFMVFVWIPISILFAPVAAIISAGQARSRKLNTLYYGLIGALYSAFLLLPWIYLVCRLAGRRVPVILIMTGYFIVFVVWSLSVFFTYGFLITKNHPLASPALFVSGSFVVGTLVILTALAVPWGDPVPWSGPGRQRAQGQLQPSSEYRHRLRDFVYLAPFIFATAQAVALEWSIRYPPPWR